METETLYGATLIWFLNFRPIEVSVFAIVTFRGGQLRSQTGGRLLLPCSGLGQSIVSFYGRVI